MSSRWHEAWKRPRQGFHQTETNAHLKKHLGWLSQSGTDRVFVPLCGCSLDLECLTQHYRQVVGVELVEAPVQRFFEERSLSPDRGLVGRLERFSAGPYVLWRGDIFETTADLVGAVDGLFDRAALVALPKRQRPHYARQLTALARPDARCLLVTMHYDQEAASGPPFSVPDDEVEALFGADWALEAVEHPIPRSTPPRFGELRVRQTVWQMTRKPAG